MIDGKNYRTKDLRVYGLLCRYMCHPFVTYTAHLLNEEEGVLSEGQSGASETRTEVGVGESL